MSLLQTAAGTFLSQLGGDAGGADQDTVASGLADLLPTSGGDLDIQSLIGRFSGSGGGLGELAASWLGNGGNLSISGEQLESVLGDGRIQAFAQKLGIEPGTALDGLAGMLPKLIDSVSQGGELSGDLLGQLGRGILGKLF